VVNVDSIDIFGIAVAAVAGVALMVLLWRSLWSCWWRGPADQQGAVATARAAGTAVAGAGSLAGVTPGPVLRGSVAGAGA
jgi:hypothetical protein